MRPLKALILAGGLLAGMAGESGAQVSVAVGNPYGTGVYVGSYGAGGLGYPGYYNGVYNSGYLGGPGTFAYGSGYRGYAAPVVGGYGYGYRPNYTGYGYSGYRTGGFRPFRGLGRAFR